MFVARFLVTLTLRRHIKPCNKIIVSLSSAASSNIIKSPFKDLTIPETSIPEYLFSQYQKHEHSVATECAISGRKYTYGDVIKKSRNLAKNLRKKLGLKERDVVALFLPNMPEYPISLLGLLQGGFIVTTINTIYTPQEIARQFANSSTVAVITLAELLPVVAAAAKILNKSLSTLAIKTEQAQSLPSGTLDFGEFINTDSDYPEFNGHHHEDVALLPYSSGTTGLPKGVQLTHYNIIANICQNSSPELPLIEETTKDHEEVIPVILPMFHIYGLAVNTFMASINGVKLVTLSKFTPESYLAMLRKYKPDVLFLVPPIVLFLTTHPLVKREDLQSVRAVMSGAAPLGASDEARFMEKTGKNTYILQGYGLTETSPTVTTVPLPLRKKKDVGGSVGLPVANTLIKILPQDDPTGRPLGPNEAGELLVKGPQVMKSYLNQPEANKSSFTDGWYRTGDMAFYDEEKLFFITERLKELIKVKGFQVAPAELEEIIRSFPNVEEAAVIGVPHPTFGEVPRAYVVVKKNAKLDTARLEEFVKNEVAEFKQLRGGVEAVDMIPKNPSGKILRRALKEMYAQKHVKK